MADVLVNLPGGWQLFYRPESLTMNLRSADPGFWIEKDGKVSNGLWVVACKNPRSADYHPANFNRMRRMLLGRLWAEGRAFPEDIEIPDEAEIKPRHLRRRMPALVKAFGSSPVHDAS